MALPAGQITPHFSWAEMTVTEVRRLAASNRQAAAAFAAPLLATCSLLEQIRELLGVAVHVNSGYRCQALNEAIGGSKTSQHPKGEAADIVPIGLDLTAAFNRIRTSGIEFGQLILEDGDGDDVPTWLHVSTPRADRENQEALLFNGKRYVKAPPIG